MKCHSTRCRIFQIRNDPEKSRLSAATRPDYTDELVDRDVEGHIAKRFDTAAVAVESVADFVAREVERGGAAQRI
jgi:hypothetical protein